MQNLVHSYEVYSEGTELDLRVEGVELALDQAIPCGLILNELIDYMKTKTENKKSIRISKLKNSQIFGRLSAKHQAC